MKIQLEAKTFNKSVIKMIKDKMPKVKGFRKHGKKLVALLGEDKKTIATWNTTIEGSYITLNSWY